uniref:Uncharacterized protein n=1 Tax=Anguilla anguilla TaxID=7936 RepID=A0A0E9PLH7_ANGAN
MPTFQTCSIQVCKSMLCI